MKEIAALAMNASYLETKEGKLAASIELIFVVTEPKYRVDQSGEVAKMREVDTMRMTASTGACRKMALDLIKWADEEDGHAARLSKSDPTTKDR